MTRARLVGKTRGHAEEGFSVSRRGRAVDEIKLSPAAADLPRADALGADLPVEIDGETAVDRDHVVILCDDGD